MLPSPSLRSGRAVVRKALKRVTEKRQLIMNQLFRDEVVADYQKSARGGGFDAVRRITKLGDLRLKGFAPLVEAFVYSAGS